MDELLCTRCGHPVADHTIGFNAVPADMLARLTEARFPDVTISGMYCPHLDMVAGEDYDDG